MKLKNGECGNNNFYDVPDSSYTVLIRNGKIGVGRLSSDGAAYTYRPCIWNR